jgi:phosphoribosyl 1,2-cyclic phosphate phosphodiesterase
MTKRLRVTLLGCGSSGGVPRVGDEWGACDPAEPRNRRLRCSLLLEQYQDTYDHDQATVVLIDTSPDLREQMLHAKVRHIDGLIYSHDHADQSHGIDDLRALVYAQRKLIPTFMDEATRQTLTTKFSYIFQTPIGSSYPPLLKIQAPVKPGDQVEVEGPGGVLRVTILAQNHGEIDSLGFRVGNVAYCNDCKDLPENTFMACEQLDLFIVDALRYAPHPSHSHLEQTLAWVNRLKPRHTVLTNMHIDLDYQTLLRGLPAGVEPGYDFWTWDGAVE